MVLGLKVTKQTFYYPGGFCRPNQLVSLVIVAVVWARESFASLVSGRYSGLLCQKGILELIRLILQAINNTGARKASFVYI